MTRPSLAAHAGGALLGDSRLGTGSKGPWENRRQVMRDALAAGLIHYPVVDGWLNATYSVQLLEHDTHPGIAHLIVRRHDEGIEFSWSDLQQIKDRFAGQGRWAIEMFPTRDALVDNANLRHLWVMPAGWSLSIDLREVCT